MTSSVSHNGEKQYSLLSVWLVISKQDMKFTQRPCNNAQIFTVAAFR